MLINWIGRFFKFAHQVPALPDREKGQKISEHLKSSNFLTLNVGIHRYFGFKIPKKSENAAKPKEGTFIAFVNTPLFKSHSTSYSWCFLLKKRWVFCLA
jgi:hypothetical protein